MKPDYRFIGKSVPRVGVTDRLKGRPVFSADMELDNPLCLRVLRSDRGHARVVKIEVEGAYRVNGVVRVFTAEDVPGKNLTGIINKDRPLLVPDKVRFIGDAVALVAAETEKAAEEALQAIHVTYEDLPVVQSPEEALREDAPKIHEKGNLLFTRKIRKGDVEKAFGRCAVLVERTYRTPYLEHTYLEPDAGAGTIDEDGAFVIMVSTQNPHYDHGEVISLLGVDDDRVRIVQAATGGGFGSKLDLNVQGFIGLALYHLKRPVRYVYTREEAYLATSKRHPLTMEFKTGADKDGRLLAMKARIVCDTGAYGSYGIAVAARAAVHATGPYEIGHVDVETLCVYTNRPVSGAMRGFGVPQVAFAHESQLNLLAESLGVDPMEVRRINRLKTGSRTATGQVLKESVGIGDCLEAVRPHYEWATRTWRTSETSPFIRRGVGIGAMWYGIGNTGVQNPSTAQVELGKDGSVVLYTGCADIGQGSSTVLCQIAAEVLGLSPGEIRAVAADTKYTTNAGATSASRQTYISGNAVRDAAWKLADVLLTEGVELLKVPKEALSLDGGFVVYTQDPEKRISLARLADRVHRKRIPLRWAGYFDPATVPLNPETGEGVPYATYAYACHLALVTVDTLTGDVEVNRVVAAHDVGRAVHPAGVIGQICGGVAMGVGFALMEEYVPGKTESMKDYPIPTCKDMPEVLPLIVESPEPTGPFGAKGVGEPALIPTAPAVMNALSDALGKRLYALPAHPEKVLKAIGRFG